jgi:hypothetical protein
MKSKRSKKWVVDPLTAISAPSKRQDARNLGSRRLPPMYERAVAVVTELGERWRVHARVAVHRGRPVVVYLEVWPREDRPSPEGLTQTALRDLSMRDAVDAVLRENRRVNREFGVSLPSLWRLKPTSRQGPNADWWAKVARYYLDALMGAQARRPIVAVAERLLHEGIKSAERTEWVRDQVHLARKYEWLTPSRRGVGGAEPTEKLKRWERAQRRRKR